MIKGKIIQVIYTKNNFSVIKVRDTKGSVITASGKIFKPQIDMCIEMEGTFVKHPKYGTQFDVASSRISIEKTESAAVKYLSSGLIVGVGPILAKRIVEEFGPNVIEEVIEKDFTQLCKVKGISEDKAIKIAKSHSENFVYQELAAMGLSISQIHKLHDKYGKDAVSVLKLTPYKPIYDIDGFGFKIVDRIAQKNGIAIDDPMRISAAITFSLTNIGEDGHCWCHIDSLAELIDKVIPEVPAEKVADQLVVEIDKGRIVRDGDKVYAQALYWAEVSTAKGIAHMAHDSERMNTIGGLPINDRQIDRAIREMEENRYIQLESHQKEAIRTSLRNRISVITGGPGTGKSTIAKAIVDAWMKQYPFGEDPNKHIVLCAPTGRAARRASELTGVKGETIQRIIFRRAYEGIEEPLLFILDEASMLDIRLACSLIDLVRDRHFLVLLGDVDQLPPIGPGHFFRDCVQCPFVPTTHLTLCHRQKGKIAVNAKRINDGMGFHSLNLEDPSFRFVYAEKDTAQDTVVDEYIKLLDKGYALKDICCIVPVRKTGKSKTSAEDLNPIIRDRVNPAAMFVKTPDPQKFRVGDRVMNTENDYDLQVFNGDCGIVSKVDDVSGIITLTMDDGRLVDFNRNMANFLILAYATTVHKAQGSGATRS